MSAARTLVSQSPEETQAIGERLGARLGPGAVIACTGALGAGKTCFLQGLARGLGVTSDVTSPTFVLINQYRGRLPVYHLDAYRTGSLTELTELGIEEMLHGDGVTVVEWARRRGDRGGVGRQAAAAPARAHDPREHQRARRRAARDPDRGARIRSGPVIRGCPRESPPRIFYNPLRPVDQFDPDLGGPLVVNDTGLLSKRLTVSRGELDHLHPIELLQGRG